MPCEPFCTYDIVTVTKWTSNRPLAVGGMTLVIPGKKRYDTAVMDKPTVCGGGGSVGGVAPLGSSVGNG
jgi:hypothetical protein